MSYSKAKKLLLVLGIMFFFVLFLPITGPLTIVQAGDEATKEDTTAKEVLPEIKLNVNSKELVKGKSYLLKVYNTTPDQTISFKTSDERYVTVTDTGLIKGVDIGSATITGTVKEGTKIVKTLECDITVGVPALSVRITKSDILLVIGQSTTLKVLVAPYNTVEEIRFSSSDYKVVDITPGGRIKALEVGTANVYALIDNGYSKCRVTVITEEKYQEYVNLGITDFSAFINDTVTPTTSGAINASNDKPSSDLKTE